MTFLKYPVLSLLAITFFISFWPVETADAKYYRSYSSYRAPSYNRSYYNRQQTYRQNNAYQRQQQANAARQRATQLRSQQLAARNAMKQQQRMVRDRQIAMQRQMKQKQQQAIAQQTKRLQLQREKMLLKQKSIQGNQLAKLKKDIQQRQLLREQKKLKNRNLKLAKLAKDRNKKLNNQKQKEQKDKANRLAQLVITAKPNMPSFSKTNFKSAQSTQALRNQLSKSFDKARQATKAKFEKTLKNNKSLFTQKQTEKKKALTEKQQQAKKLAQSNFSRCAGGVCKTGFCSFHGETLVQTKNGFAPIKSLTSNDLVWARNEFTGEMDWKPVIGVFSNSYDEIINVSIKDSKTGHIQTIQSNRIHPFYISDNKDSIFEYGTNATGQWIQAQNLKQGQLVLNAEGLSSVVQNVSVEQSPFNAYNITVDEYSTYFVKASNAAEANPVWVHNDKGCDNNQKLKYNPTEKHDQKSGWDTKMDLDDRLAKVVLNKSIRNGKQRYGYHQGKVYAFQADNRGSWHGYPIKGNKVPSAVLKEMKIKSMISRKEYNKLRKGKEKA